MPHPDHPTHPEWQALHAQLAQSLARVHALLDQLTTVLHDDVPVAPGPPAPLPFGSHVTWEARPWAIWQVEQSFTLETPGRTRVYYGVVPTHNPAAALSCVDEAELSLVAEEVAP